MKILIFMTVVLFIAIVSLRADETSLDDEDFTSALNQTRNPFLVDLPKQVIEVPKYIEPPKPVAVPTIVKPPVVAPLVISLPALHLEGVVVGEEMNQAIINDQVVPLQGMIAGAQVISVTKDGVQLLFKGKKFFLKSD